MISTNGYYQVGNKTFQCKAQALIEASTEGIKPQWIFNDDVFGAIDWTIPLSGSIETYYKKRCLQLRESYDYLVLNFSGGSDSTTILTTFLQNNIKLDQISTYWPHSLWSNHFAATSNVQGAANRESEWELTVKPVLEYVQKFYPEIKIHFIDYSDSITTEILEHEYQIATHHENIGYFKRQLANYNAHKHLIDKGSTSAIITGNDKPQLAILPDGIYAYFLDILTSTAMVQNEKTNQQVEFFYWSRDMPELAVKSCQELAYYVKQTPSLHRLFQLGARKTEEEKTLLDEVVRSVVYPSWKHDVFQANKPLYGIYSDADQWIHYKFKNERFYQSWESRIRSHCALIDDQYFSYINGQKDQYIGFVSPFYKICNL